MQCTAYQLSGTTGKLRFYASARISYILPYLRTILQIILRCLQIIQQMYPLRIYVVINKSYYNMCGLLILCFSASWSTSSTTSTTEPSSGSDRVSCCCSRDSLHNIHFCFPTPLLQFGAYPASQHREHLERRSSITERFSIVYISISIFHSSPSRSNH